MSTVITKDSTTYKTLLDINDSLPVHIKYANSVPVSVGVPVIITSNDDAGKKLRPLVEEE